MAKCNDLGKVKKLKIGKSAAKYLIKDKGSTTTLVHSSEWKWG